MNADLLTKLATMDMVPHGLANDVCEVKRPKLAIVKSQSTTASGCLPQLAVVPWTGPSRQNVFQQRLAAKVRDLKAVCTPKVRPVTGLPIGYLTMAKGRMYEILQKSHIAGIIINGQTVRINKILIVRNYDGRRLFLSEQESTDIFIEFESCRQKLGKLSLAQVCDDVAHAWWSSGKGEFLP